MGTYRGRGYSRYGNTWPPPDPWDYYVAALSPERRREEAAKEMRQIDPALSDDEQAARIASIRRRYLLQ